LKYERLISIIPDLKDGNGHMLFYHKALGESLKILGIKHSVLYFSQEMNVELAEWSNCIKIGSLDQNIKIYIKKLNPFQIIIDCINFIGSINKNLTYKNINKNILFIERFNLPELYCLGILSIIKKYPLVILFRHDQNYLRAAIFYKIIIYIINLLNNKKLLLLTDSSVLTANLKRYFHTHIDTLPIPLNLPKLNKKQEDGIIKVWWPGAPREDKGPEIVLKLLDELIKNKKNIKLFISSELIDIKNSNVVYLDKYLTDELYLKYLNDSDVIFLPYCKIKYKSSTSNIFVEAILLKKKVLVTKGTWMESELKNFGLECLVVDWEKCEIAAKIEDIYRDESIIEKIESMSNLYSKFHSIIGFSNEIARALNKLDIND